MNDKILQYALFPHFYKTSVLDCFIPFLISSMEKGIAYSADELQRAIDKKYKILIPIHVIRALVHQCIGKGYIDTTTTKRNPFPGFITESGLAFKDTIFGSDAVARDIAYLENELLLFFETNSFCLPDESLILRIERIIERNITNFSEYFIGCNSTKQLDGMDETDNRVIDFIIQTEKSSPHIYELITNIFYGSIYKSSLCLSSDELDGVLRDDFSNIKLYFDANFLFSLLKLHDAEYSTPVNELFQILKSNKFQFRVFDITIDEMVHVLRGYLTAQNFYPQNIRVNSLYSFLKRNQYDQTKLLELILQLPEMLENLGVMKKVTGINLMKYTPKDSEISSKLRQLKPYQPDFYHNHDVAIIERTLKFNKSRIYKFEDAKELFVTSDFILAKLSRVHSRHDSTNSISEIILDRILTNLLFLKNPQSQVSLESIISIFKRETFIKRSVWEQFFKTVVRLKDEGRINENSIVNLFYSNVVESDLRYLTEQDVEALSEEKVLEMFESASIQVVEQKKLNTLRQEELKSQFEDDVSKKIFSVINEQEGKRNEERVRIIGVLQSDAETEAQTLSICVRILVGLLLLAPGIPILMEVFRKIYKYDSLMSIIRYLFFILDLLAISIRPLWENLENKSYKKRLQKKLEKFGLIQHNEEPS